MTVAELGQRMSGRELREWVMLWQIEAKERLAAEAEARATQGVKQQIKRGAR